MADTHVDILIIGAGMAGASLAAAIGDRARVAIVEAEDFPGYHATGRSAAFWSESYGGSAVQPLTTASQAALAPYLSPRGCFHIADDAGIGLLDTLEQEFDGRAPAFERLDATALHAAVPGLHPRYRAALSEPSCRDIDVAALHTDYLVQSNRSGTRAHKKSQVLALTREALGWSVETTAGLWGASIVVDAAGAWASEIATMAGAAPIEVAPYRRTVVQLQTDPGMSPDMPLIMDAAGQFYFKPEAGGRLWLSPHDEHRSAPQDVQPEELDIAIAIDRFEHVVDWRVVKRERAWAGLRSFAPDRIPVYGFDPRAPGFFWFAGQGGFGIQTAPAAAEIGAALLLGVALPASVANIDVALYSPARFAF